MLLLQQMKDMNSFLYKMYGPVYNEDWSFIGYLVTHMKPVKWFYVIKEIENIK